MLVRILVLIWIAGGASSAVRAQSIAPDTAEAGSVEEIAKATTEPRFSSPWVSYVPASSTVPSPSAFFGRIAGAPGELVDSAQAYAYARALAAASPRVKVYTIGVGVRGKAPVPVRDEAGNMRLVMAEVDVDEKTLQTVADQTGGKFYRATDTDSLKKIYEQINRLETSAQTVQKFENYDELYPWALIPALAILGFSFLLQHTRYRRLP